MGHRLRQEFYHNLPLPSLQWNKYFKSESKRKVIGRIVLWLRRILWLPSVNGIPHTVLISQVLADAATQVDLDLSRLYLAGLSNGGLGVSRLATVQPEKFRGLLIFLSPVMDTTLVDSSTFHQAWHERPVLVITGAADEQIPLSYVQQRVTAFKAGGVAVTERVYPGEDHFLFFSQPEAVLSGTSAWMAATAG